MEEQISNQFTFKFLITGNGGVGKTAIVNRFTHNDFEYIMESTIGVEFFTHVLTIENTPVKLQIWDTAGQEQYRSIGKAYYHGAIGVFLVFSLNNHDSFEALGSWLDDIKHYCHPKAKIILIGNKCDLVNERTVSISEAHSFATSNQLQYFETSALENTNIAESFIQAAREIYQMVITNEISPESTDQDIHLTEQAPKQKKCCK